MKKYILSFVVILGLFSVMGCDYPNQTPDEYVNSTIDPGLQDIAE